MTGRTTPSPRARKRAARQHALWQSRVLGCQCDAEIRLIGGNRHEVHMSVTHQDDCPVGHIGTVYGLMAESAGCER